ncbi:RNA polymerase sigma factor [Nonomuraea jiangxiensis]|uniref:RNA polymerase sigma factor, sigma-70 family n=1 Tax=Nonomuraea jiangxiensis TaxID=633440 RepID=A0A1G8XRY4_9ACTN|nr:sigma-70 family RNA polymerase sigma factor [Nonomuraea jiangxiensis]SDJ92655.1 RNA polymerase sigma factor, sigma-70 family [Nonomuraea jiangxiensis]
MNDRVLVEALRARDAGAIAALYDAYAEGIYRYCWSLLLSADSAQVALRDTLIAAEAHAGALADPDRLGTWLYALARAECLRRRAAAPPGAAQALAQAPPLHDPADADLRIMAWNAVQSLPVADREVLELSHRHELPMPELAQVLGSPARRVEALQDTAREHLGDAITAEFLARKGPYDCAVRARILTGFSGELTREMREHLVGHLQHCETCAPHRGRQVSAAKVFQLLPPPVLPDSLRLRVLSCFLDPELLPYRRYVARRTAALGAAGFPVPTERNARRWPQALAGALAAIATVVAIALIFDQLGGETGGPAGVATAAFPATGEPPAIRLPWQADPREEPQEVPEEVPLTVRPALDTRTTQPLGVTSAPTPAPPAVTPAPVGSRPPGDQPPGRPRDPLDPGTSPPPQHSPSSEPPSGEPRPRPRPRPSTPCPTTPAPTPSATPTPTPTQPPTPTVTPTEVATSAPTQEPSGTPAEPPATT